jgi:hypothetical protein
MTNWLSTGICSSRYIVKERMWTEYGLLIFNLVVVHSFALYMRKVVCEAEF